MQTMEVEIWVQLVLCRHATVVHCHIMLGGRIVCMVLCGGNVRLLYIRRQKMEVEKWDQLVRRHATVVHCRTYKRWKLKNGVS